MKKNQASVDRVTAKEEHHTTFRDQYITLRHYSELICKPLQTEDFVVQPNEDVSPPKWHLAHTTWFWEEFILSKYFSQYTRFHPRYSFLFNSYYNSVGERVLRPHRGNLSRPTVEEILDYRAYVDEFMITLLQFLPEEAMAVVTTGVHHEQQHQELLFTDIKYILGHNPLFPPYQDNFRETNEIQSDEQFIEIPEAQHQIGFQGKGFSFDNEHEAHRVFLGPFAIRRSLVTNREYMEFMQDGGYRHPQWWLSDGWTWLHENQVDSPLYWHFIDGLWYRYALAGLELINPDEPVTHISFYEATAFAEWKSMRLPTEFEWEASCHCFRWGERWEHMNSAYLPYPGYTKPEGAVGEYNGKFMVNQMVLRGGSIVTPPGHTRKTYRNFFHPSARWQFNGIRLCKKKVR